MESLKARFSSVFSRIGKVKNYQLKLHIDPHVVPVAQKMHRIPFSLQDKVTVRVNELLENDMIEGWKGLQHRLARWLSHLNRQVIFACVLTCVGPTKRSCARAGLPIPTVEEVLESLNASTVFSKLDLR